MDRETAEIAKRFVKALRRDFSGAKIILFGSRARGDNFKKSDFDFIIINEKFKKIPFILRPAKIYDYWHEDVDIEAICYAPEEFERKKKEFGIVRRAVKEGIAL